MISRASSNDSSLLSSIATLGTFAAVKALLGPTSAQERAKPGSDLPTSEREPLSIHHARAREPGRGRAATRPSDIPWSGWMDILWRTAKQIQEDRLLAIAAGVVFYALLAIFPAVTALISLYGLFASVDTVRQHLEFAQSLLPAGVVQIIDEQVARLIAKGEASSAWASRWDLASRCGAPMPA
jgi:membrane protein